MTDAPSPPRRPLLDDAPSVAAEGPGTVTRAASDPADRQPRGGPEPSSVDRRSFFRVFSRQTVSTVAQIAGMAGSIQRGTTAAMVGAVGIGLGPPAQSAARLAPAELGATSDPSLAGNAALADGPRFRSPYRMSEGTLYLLDQRLLPERTEEIACHRAADVAFQMRTLAVNGAALLGQLAAYGLALTADEARDWVPARRRAELRRASQLLTYARPAARPVRAALAQVEARTMDLLEVEPTNGDAIADAYMQEADAIASSAAADHAAIARATVDLLGRAPGEPLRILLVGDPGILTTGQVGTAIPALRMLAQAGVELSVFVAEGRPRLEGARLATWELRLSGIDHTVVGDSAVGWLLAGEPLDAVLMGADWIAANGDIVATIGARSIAELAAVGLRDGRPTPVYVLSASVSVGTEPFAAGAIPAENRPGRELAADHGAGSHAGTMAVNPAVEVVPHERISAVITERGIHREPYSQSLPIPASLL